MLTSDILERLDRLERENRRMRRAGAALVLVLGSVFLGAMIQEDKIPDIVRARAFVVPADGKRPAVWIGEDGGSGFVSLGNNNGEWVEIGAMDKARLILHHTQRPEDAAPKTQVLIGLQDHAGFVSASSERGLAVEMDAGAPGGRLSVYEPAPGKGPREVARLSNGEQGTFLSLFEIDGTSLATIGAVDDGSFVITRNLKGQSIGIAADEKGARMAVDRDNKPCLSLGCGDAEPLLEIRDRVGRRGAILGFGSNQMPDLWLLGEDGVPFWSAALNAVMASPSAAYPRRSGATESGHWIKSITADGSVIILEDSSAWEVSSLDRITSTLWLPLSEITVLPDGRLVNDDDGEIVEVRRLR